MLMIHYYYCYYYLRPVLTVDCLVVDLQGGEYEFRVKAVNAAGPSRPSATAGPLIIKDQTCDYPANTQF